MNNQNQSGTSRQKASQEADDIWAPSTDGSSWADDLPELPPYSGTPSETTLSTSSLNASFSHKQPSSGISSHASSSHSVSSARNGSGDGTHHNSRPGRSFGPAHSAGGRLLKNAIHNATSQSQTQQQRRRVSAGSRQVRHQQHESSSMQQSTQTKGRRNRSRSEDHSNVKRTSSSDTKDRIRRSITAGNEASQSTSSVAAESAQNPLEMSLVCQELRESVIAYQHPQLDMLRSLVSKVHDSLGSSANVLWQRLIEGHTGTFTRHPILVARYASLDLASKARSLAISLTDAQLDVSPTQDQMLITEITQFGRMVFRNERGLDDLFERESIPGLVALYRFIFEFSVPKLDRGTDFYLKEWLSNTMLKERNQGFLDCLYDDGTRGPILIEADFGMGTETAKNGSAKSAPSGNADVRAKLPFDSVRHLFLPAPYNINHREVTQGLHVCGKPVDQLETITQNLIKSVVTLESQSWDDLVIDYGDLMSKLGLSDQAPKDVKPPRILFDLVRARSIDETIPIRPGHIPDGPLMFVRAAKVDEQYVLVIRFRQAQKAQQAYKVLQQSPPDPSETGLKEASVMKVLNNQTLLEDIWYEGGFAALASVWREIIESRMMNDRGFEFYFDIWLNNVRFGCLGRHSNYQLLRLIQESDFQV